MVSAEELRLYRSAYQHKTANAYIFAAGADPEAERAAVDFMLRLYCRHGIGCRACDECRKVINDNHVDIMNIGGDGTIKKEAVEPIIDFISKRAFEGGYKCVVIRNAHNMGESPQNFLLKSIEEPPENVVFILTTSAPDKLLSTIRSRSLIIRIPPTPRRSIMAKLPDTELAAAAAAQSGGSLSQAQEYLDSSDFSAARDAAYTVTDMLSRFRRPSLFKMSELALSVDTSVFLTAFFYAVRDALYLSLTGDTEYLYDPANSVAAEALSKVVTDTGLMKICQIITKTSDAKRLSPGINSQSAVRAMLFDIMEVRNKCLK